MTAGSQCRGQDPGPGSGWQPERVHHREAHRAHSLPRQQSEQHFRSPQGPHTKRAGSPHRQPAHGDAAVREHTLQPESRHWAPESAWQPGMHEGYREYEEPFEARQDGYREDHGGQGSAWHAHHGDHQAHEPEPSRKGHPAQPWYDLDEVASKSEAKTAVVAADMYDL